MDEPETKDYPELVSGAGAPAQSMLAIARMPRAVAPLWHTIVLVLLILGTSAAGALTLHRSAAAEGHHVPNYLLTMAWEWLLVLYVFWGLRLRRTPLRQIIGPLAPGARGFFEDAGVALAFWFVSMLALALLAAALKPLHIDPEGIRKIVSKLAPSTAFELLLWIAMSLTAGICEELLFRGYLQQQFAVWTRHAWMGLLASALLFGVAHGYEGISGMLLITAYGALFGTLARLRGNLRPGIMAHAWHDSMSGIVLFAAHHLVHRTLP